MISYYSLPHLVVSLEYFITNDIYHGLVSSISETFSAHGEIALHDNLTLPLETFTAPLTLLHTILETRGANVLAPSGPSSLFPNVFLFAHLIPKYRTMEASQKQAAENLWRMWLSKVSDDDGRIANGVIKSNIRDMLSDCFTLAK